MEAHAEAAFDLGVLALGMNTMLFLPDCPGYREGNWDGVSATVLDGCCGGPVSRILDWSVSFGFSVFDEPGLLHHD